MDRPDPDGAGPLAAPWMVSTYDLTGRTTSETNRLGHATQFQHDNLGRLIKTADAEAGETTYSYDDEGNRLSKTNIATGAFVEYTWDHRNRLTGIVTKDSHTKKRQPRRP